MNESKSADALLSRIRALTSQPCDSRNMGTAWDLLREAAAEIERLREQLDKARAIIGHPYTENSSDREHLRAEFAIAFAHEIEEAFRG